MSIRVAVLGSGSSGNCTFVASSRARVLVDAGFSCREITKRLSGIGERPESVQAVLITHEHSDHINGLARLAKKHGIPVYISARTRAALPPGMDLSAVETIEPGKAFVVGDLTIEPFSIPHDAVDPVAFRMSAEGLSVAVATDLGYLPENVKYHLRGCHAMVIESNHDVEMLRTGPYPWYVKERVWSRTGHLSNRSLSEFLRDEYDGAAQAIVLAHLSEQNNHPQIARMEAAAALESRSNGPAQLVVSQQNESTPVFEF